MRLMRCIVQSIAVCSIVTFMGCVGGSSQQPSSTAVNQTSEEYSRHEEASTEGEEDETIEAESSESEVGQEIAVICYQGKEYYGLFMSLDMETLGDIDHFEKIGQIQGYVSGFTVDKELYTNFSESIVGNDVYMGETEDLGVCFILEKNNNGCIVLAYAKTEKPGYLQN